MKRLTLMRVLAVAMCCLPSLAMGAVVADSAADWSADGTQGANGWTYGYYDATADADATYGADDFAAFEGPNWVWANNAWDEANVDGDNVPWTTVAQESGHPNGDNNGVVHHAIRRWESSVDGDATINWSLAKQNANCGNGTSVMLYHNGTEIAAGTIGGTDAVGISGSVSATLSAGDVLDLSLSPLGLDGTLNDGCDGSFYAMNVDVVPEPSSALLLLAGLAFLPRRRKR